MGMGSGSFVRGGDLVGVRVRCAVGPTRARVTVLLQTCRCTIAGGAAMW